MSLREHYSVAEFERLRLSANESAVAQTPATSPVRQFQETMAQVRKIARELRFCLLVESNPANPQIKRTQAANRSCEIEHELDRLMALVPAGLAGQAIWAAVSEAVGHEAARLYE